MGNHYVRVGNRTFKNEAYKRLTEKEKQTIVKQGQDADKKRLENMRKGLGLEPQQGITLDVTPAGVAKRNEAIKAEEAKIAAEEVSSSEEVTVETAKKSKGKSKKESVAAE